MSKLQNGAIVSFVFYLFVSLYRVMVRKGNRHILKEIKAHVGTQVLERGLVTSLW